jgi:hypothetical protein
MNMKRLWDRAQARARERNTYYGTLGKHNPDTSITYAVAGRVDQLWVTLSDKTPVQARNEAGVAQVEDLPVKLIIEHGQHVIVGRATSGTLAVPTETPPSGVLPHPIEDHSDVVLTAAAAGDVFVYDGSNWINETPIDVSAGAADAGRLIRLDATGMVDASMIDDVDINLDNVTEGTTNKFFTNTEKTKLAGIEEGANLYVHPNHSGDVTSVGDGATTIAANAVTNTKLADMVESTIKGRAAAAGTGDPTDLTATQVRTLINVESGADVTDAGNIASSIDGAVEQTSMEAANRVPLTDTGVLKWISWTNILASLVTNALTWLANVTIASTATTGNALRVVRDLAAASTNAPVVDLVQDNVGDDQATLRVQQDGGGDIAQFFDGATEVVVIEDGGVVDIGSYGTGAVAFGGLVPLKVAGNSNEIISFQMQNKSTGTSADTRLAMFDSDKDSYLAFALPGKNNSASLFGIVRNTAAFLFANAGTLTRHLVIGTVPAKDVVFGTTNLERMRLTAAGLLGVGIASPQSKFHVYDGIGNIAFVSKSGIVGSAQEVLVTGSVTRIAQFSGIVFTAVEGERNNFTVPIVPGSSVDFSTGLGANTLRFTCASGGQVTVIRQAGTGTLATSGMITWI